MELNVRVEKSLPILVPDAISFETGASRVQVETPELFAYEHHGSEFTAMDRSALVRFYEELILGRPLPATFATRGIQDIDTVVAIALFLNRDLATLPATPEFVYTVDFVHRLGLPALAHIDESKARFLSALRQYFPETGMSQRELSERIVSSVTWIREYLQDGTIPILGQQPNSDVRVIDHGTTGFVIAETRGSLVDGWVELYRLGFLRGALIRLVGDRKQVLVSRKSLYVPFDLQLAARLLNQLESAMGESSEWRVTPDGLWLESGAVTALLLDHIREVLVRV